MSNCRAKLITKALGPNNRTKITKRNQGNATSRSVEKTAALFPLEAMVYYGQLAAHSPLWDMRVDWLAERLECWNQLAWSAATTTTTKNPFFLGYVWDEVVEVHNWMKPENQARIAALKKGGIKKARPNLAHLSRFIKTKSVEKCAAVKEGCIRKNMPGPRKLQKKKLAIYAGKILEVIEREKEMRERKEMEKLQKEMQKISLAEEAVKNKGKGKRKEKKQKEKEKTKKPKDANRIQKRG
ncbi:hypothetical protein BDD12DRAFT_940557 [Trichophaea hybrida]|nr:hypothetical protein BDD12DRAFT_940557 [Trichophaea hybrida]